MPASRSGVVDRCPCSISAAGGFRVFMLSKKLLWCGRVGPAPLGLADVPGDAQALGQDFERVAVDQELPLGPLELDAVGVPRYSFWCRCSQVTVQPGYSQSTSTFS